MLHSEPSFCVYADEDALLHNENGDLRVQKGSGEFSFAENLGLIVENDEDDRSTGLQSNGDLNGAEEYYFRATMADPKNGEILMQYAKLVWELHRDRDRATSYFESAIRAAPQDCDVLAAYASFLWELDEDECDHEESLEVEERPYRRMVIKNPSDPLVLGDYARFLLQSKGDLEGAELYYSRAFQAGSNDGQVISQYAQLVWGLHRDQYKASHHFERAVKAAPTDSRVLAAYAKFLWEAEDEEDAQV